MRTPFKIVAVLLLFGLISGALVWSSMDSDPLVVIDEDELDQARESGVGSMGIELEDRPEWRPSNLGEVRALLGAEAHETALTRLSGFVESKPESGAGHILLAEVLRRLDRLDEALLHAEKGAALLSTHGRAHWVHSRVLASRLTEIAKTGGSMGIFRAARNVGPYRSALRTAIELDPSNVEARREEVLFYLATPMIGDPAKGLKLARSMEAEHPMHGKLTVARALFFSDRKEEAINLAREAVDLFPESTEPTWILGSILFRSKRFDEAENEFAKLVSGPKDETYYQAMYSRMCLRTRQDKDAEGVLKLVKEYLAADPQWEWAPKPSDVWCEKGYALQDLDRVDEARAAFEKSLELNPHSKRAKESLEELNES
ncbi:MAG: tetratricopeptide repeat protein [bacterium]|nr:tetratricopeptide repeat protein [bacterium]